MIRKYRRRSVSPLYEIIYQNGFKSQTDLARAIADKYPGRYKNCFISLVTYLSQICTNKRPASDDLIEKIMMVCNNDNRIAKILRPDPNLESVLLDLDETYSKIKLRLMDIESKSERYKIMIGLEDYVTKYINPQKPGTDEVDIK